MVKNSSAGIDVAEVSDPPSAWMSNSTWNRMKRNASVGLTPLFSVVMSVAKVVADGKMREASGCPRLFAGAAWSEAALLKYAFAYEQASRARRPPTFAQTATL